MYVLQLGWSTDLGTPGTTGKTTMAKDNNNNNNGNNNDDDDDDDDDDNNNNNNNNRIKRAESRSHCAVNRFKHVRSSGPGAIVCKSRASHLVLIACNMCYVSRGTKGQLSY